MVVGSARLRGFGADLMWERFVQEHGVECETHDHAVVMTVEEQVNVEFRAECNRLVAIQIGVT